MIPSAFLTRPRTGDRLLNPMMIGSGKTGVNGKGPSPRVATRGLISPLHSRNHHFEKLPRPAGQRIDAFGFLWPGHEWRGDVLAAERHRPAGKGDPVPQLPVVDLHAS